MLTFSVHKSDLLHVLNFDSPLIVIRIK